MAELDITYTAKRGLIAGHVENESYELNIDLSSLKPYDKIKATQRIKGNKASSNLTGITSYFSVSTQRLDNTQMLAVREFLLSCANSETFTFSLLGAPIENAKLVLKNKLEPQVVSPLLYRFQFEFFVTD